MAKKRVKSSRSNRKATSVDRHVAEQLFCARQAVDMTQAAVADKLGVSHQQIQKYEASTSRISAGTLFDLSKILNVSVGWFFDGLSS